MKFCEVSRIFDFELNLKVSAFYLEKQKSFIPKKKDFLTYDKSRTNAICWRIKKKILILIPFSIGLVTLIQSSSVLAHKHESTNHLVLPTTEEEEKEELPPSWSDSLGLQYDQLFQVHIKKTKSLFLLCYS